MSLGAHNLPNVRISIPVAARDSAALKRLMPHWCVSVLSAQSGSPVGWFLCNRKAEATATPATSLLQQTRPKQARTMKQADLPEPALSQ